MTKEEIREAIERLKIYQDERETSSFGDCVRTLLSLATAVLRVMEIGEKDTLMTYKQENESINENDILNQYVNFGYNQCLREIKSVLTKEN